MSKEAPSHEFVASLLEYDAATGNLRWVKTRRGAKAGEIAGTLDAEGYLQVRVYGTFYKAHRIAWLLAYGQYPDGPIDHINNTPSDNRLSNLRVCSNSENCMNTRVRRDNTSGVKGVGWHRQRNSWRVRVKVHGKEYSGGCFKSLEDAKNAANKLREQLHGDFANHG